MESLRREGCKPTPPTRVEVSRRTLFTLLVGAQRYALGRRSYTVGLTADLVRIHAESLTGAEREVLIRDLRQHVDESSALDVSEPQDIRQTWRKLLRDLEARRA